MMRAILAVLVFASLSQADCIKCYELKAKVARELSVEEIDYLKRCSEWCVEDKSPKKKFNHGKFWLITGIVVLSVAVVNAAQ